MFKRTAFGHYCLLDRGLNRAATLASGAKEYQSFPKIFNGFSETLQNITKDVTN